MPLLTEYEQNLKHLAELASLYDQVGDLTLVDVDTIDMIERLSWDEEYTGIGSLLELEEDENVIEMFENVFNFPASQLLILADEFGFQRPKCLEPIDFQI